VPGNASSPEERLSVISWRDGDNFGGWQYFSTMCPTITRLILPSARVGLKEYTPLQSLTRHEAQVGRVLVTDCYFAPVFRGVSLHNSQSGSSLKCIFHEPIACSALAAADCLGPGFELELSSIKRKPCFGSTDLRKAEIELGDKKRKRRFDGWLGLVTGRYWMTVR